jgi:hypothetical protein
MYDIFRKQDDQLEANGRRILSEHLKIDRSTSITSSSELRAEKGTNSVGLSGAGEWNPATGRRTRLTF